MGRLAKVVLAAMLLTLLLPESASAARVIRIAELNFVFTPDPVKARMGDTVRWTNQVGNAHTTTDQSALSLWDSGFMGFSDKFDYTIAAAATYPYFCTLHERFGMFGTLQVRDEVSPASGPPGTQFTITVATQEAPVGFAYDIQRKDPQGVWQAWMSNLTEPSVVFDSTDLPEGIYQFRSRMRRTSDNAATQLSPSAGVEVVSSGGRGEVGAS